MEPIKHQLRAVGPRLAGFTLIEIVISIGVLVVAMTTIAATIGVSKKSSADSSRKVQAAWLLDGMLAEVTDSVRGQDLAGAIYRIDAPDGESSSKELLFDGEGIRVEEAGDAFYRCRLDFRTDQESAGLLHLHGRVTWPAAVREGAEHGAVELFTSILKP